MWEVTGTFKDGTPLSLFTGDWNEVIQGILAAAESRMPKNELISLRDSLGWLSPTPSGHHALVSAGSVNLRIDSL